MDMREFQIEEISELESMLGDVDVALSDASVGTSWINTIDYLQRAESTAVSLLSEIRLKILVARQALNEERFSDEPSDH